MNKKNDMMHQTEYNGNSVIDRGYAIYDEWVERKATSKMIAASAESAIRAMHKNKTMSKCAEALAYIFALDMRIKERYNTLLKRIFLYFSLRRERLALNMLKNALNIPNGTFDIRSAIEVELQRLREKIENGELDEGDDDVRGGKNTGRKEEKTERTDEKQQEAPEENKAKESSDAKKTEEASEEKTEEVKKEAQPEQKAEENADEKEALQELQNEENSIQNQEKEETKQEEYKETQETEIKEESNGPEKKSDSKKNINDDMRPYNDSADFVLFDNQPASSTPVTQPSFIEESMVYNIIKGNENIIFDNPFNSSKPSAEESKRDDAPAERNEDARTNDRDSNMRGEKDSRMQDEKGPNVTDEKTANSTNAIGKQSTEETLRSTDNTDVTKTEQPKEQMANNDTALNVNDTDDLRVPLQVDVDAEQHNAVARALNETMSLESKLSYIEMQKELMREHIRVVCEEFNNEGPVQKISKTDPPVASKQNLSPNRK